MGHDCWLKCFSFDLQGVRSDKLRSTKQHHTLFTIASEEPSIRSSRLTMMPASVFDNKHGSGAINNVPTPMALNTQSAHLNQPEGMQQATTPQATQNMSENGELWSLSESSPGQPAMARPEAELPPAGRFRRPPASSTSRGRTRLTMRSPSTNGKRGATPSRLSPPARRPPARMASPAVEKVKIEKHRVVRPELSPGTAGPNIVDSRIAALEQQQAFDHTYLEQLAAAVRSLYEAQEWERLRRGEVDDQSVLMDMNLRHELAVQREALQDMHKKVPEMASHGMQTLVGVMDEKIATIQKAIDLMHGKGERVENYLNKLHEDRPREGQAVADLVNSQVSQVKEMVSRFEPPRGDHLHPASIPFTQLMSNALKEMQDKVATHETTLKYATETLMQHADYEERIVATESQILKIINWVESGYAEQGKSEAQKATGFSMCNAYGAGIATAAQQAGTGTGTSGCHGHTPTGSWASWTGSGAGGAPPPGIHGAGAAGSSGDGGSGAAGGSDITNTLQRITGGNGRCHCMCVEALIKDVGKIKQGLEDPLFHRGWRTAPGKRDFPPERDHDQQARQGGGAERPALPLELRGPFGALNFKERALFDEKISMTGDYSFNGLKGGINWKGKVERYFISRIPVLMNVLEWAEKEELYEITPAKFEEATRGTLDSTQVQAINAAMWGFLSGAVSGTAETMFKGAAKLNGLDAWRRLVRYIDHGRAMRLETLRREVKMIHLKPIASLEKVEEGVAEFENVLNEYVQVGGTPISNDEKKSDLLAVLPAELRETLLWRATDAGSFEDFRDMVLTQCGKILMNRKKLHVHNVDHEKQQDEADEDEEGFPDLSTPEGIIAAISRLHRNGGKFQRRSSGGSGAAGGTRAEPPRARKCANCSEIHEGRCTKAVVAQADRKCWTCGKKGCRASTCPDKKVSNNRKLQAIEDGKTNSSINGFFVVDEEGFQTVDRGNRRTRPTPSQPCLGDFLSRNSFEALTPAASGDALASLPATGRPGYPRAARPGAGTKAKTPPPRPGEVAYMKEHSGPSADGSTGTAGGSSPDIKRASHNCPSGAIRRAIAEAQQAADGTGASGTKSITSTSIHRFCPTGLQDFQTPPMVDFVNKNEKVIPGRHEQGGEVRTDNTTDKRWSGREGPRMPCSGQCRETRSRPMSITSLQNAQKYAKDKNDLPNPESTPSKDTTGTGERATPRERPAETGGPRSAMPRERPAETGGQLNDDTSELKPDVPESDIHRLFAKRDVSEGPSDRARISESEAKVSVPRGHEADQERSSKRTLRGSPEGAESPTAAISCVMEEEEEPLIASAVEKVKIQVAMDSAAVDNVVHPSFLPGDAEPAPNRTGRHFVGAQGGHIEKYGSVDTKLETDLGAIGCHWQLADVTRPLHSVAKVTGPEDHPTGKQDVLFTNKKCVVVPPGVVEKMLKTVKPVVEYARTGNLYIADMEMSSFPRQGQAV